MGKQVVFYDTEFTTWPGAMESGWAEDWQHRELVQIGAIRFDVENLKEGETFDILIKPVRNPVLSDFFTELTGISNDDVAENGLSFEEACKKFVAFIGEDECYSYGTDDSVVRENAELYDIDAYRDFTGGNIGPWFARQGIDTTKVNSGALAKTLGLEMKIAEHNALEDVRSICAAFRELVANRGAENPFTA